MAYFFWELPLNVEETENASLCRTNFTTLQKKTPMVQNIIELPCNGVKLVSSGLWDNPQLKILFVEDETIHYWSLSVENWTLCARYIRVIDHWCSRMGWFWSVNTSTCMYIYIYICTHPGTYITVLVVPIEQVRLQISISASASRVS